MNEWEFTADAASWINEILTKNGGLPFWRAKCEQVSEGSHKRRDLTLLDRSHQPVLTGEVKLPYQVEGSSPYVQKVVDDARSKARTAGVRFFFTWNVNEFVLWETAPSRPSWRGRNYKAWHIVNVAREAQLDRPEVIHAIRAWLAEFLTSFAEVLLGAAAIGQKRPDEQFIEALESSLQMPINLNFEALVSLYAKPAARVELDKWMREDQGWIIYDDPEGIQDNLERAARFACYALVSKLVFYEALLKRYGVKMSRLSVPDHISSAEDLRVCVERYFHEAKEITADYETVFGETHLSTGNRIPFYSDAAVPHWRQLINQIHLFDFSQLDYEIIGNMFERLLSPEERHKYGQFYTRVEIVDLINSFCIRDGDEVVMDPACGGGTFLVRAYVRKRELSLGRSHKQLLKDIFGVDISHFATNMTTINLATRDLIEEENYPQIVRRDFFDIKNDKPLMSLPTHIAIKGLGNARHRDVDIPELDAIIGNPPYVRQEDIPKSTKKAKNPQCGTKEYYQQLVKVEAKANLSARSDIHCYFWPHASSFLKPGGYLGFITSSQWLDVEYGFRLQEWILQNFEIVAVLESIDEPWFVGARVATTVTILKRQNDEDKRMNNIVRFIHLRHPIAAILAHDGTTPGALSAADKFRNEILALKKNTANQRYRARLERQGELWNEGVQLGVLMGKSHAANNGNDADEAKPGVLPEKYYGGKWGMFLRAPDLWFAVIDRYGSNLVPLGNIAEIWRGVTSGKDAFFFPKDVSQKCLSQYHDTIEFEVAYGVPRKLVESGKVKLVLCGTRYGEIHPIEVKYLEPEVHSLMEVEEFTVAREACSHLILLVGEPKDKLRGKYVLDYINWGEKQHYHKGSTCAARASKSREWYDLKEHKRGQLLWPKAQQYKHIIALNTSNLILNNNLYYIHTDDDPGILGGILNSTWTVLSKFQYGRPVGVEGNLKTEVIDTKMMLVPNPSKATEAARKAVFDAFAQMQGRKAMGLLSERRLRRMSYTAQGKEEKLQQLSDLSELDMADRRKLDDAVLQLMGVPTKEERDSLLDHLYEYLRKFFESTRQKEEKAIINKKRAKRRGPAKPGEIAVQVYKEILDNEPRLLLRYDPEFINKDKPFDTFDLPGDGKPTAYKDMFIPHGVRFDKAKKSVGLVKTRIPEQDQLIILLAESGIRGLVRVPHESDECDNVFERYERFVKARELHIRQLVELRTANADMQEKIIKALRPLLGRS